MLAINSSIRKKYLTKPLKPIIHNTYGPYGVFDHQTIWYGGKQYAIHAVWVGLLPMQRWNPIASLTMKEQGVVFKTVVVITYMLSCGWILVYMHFLLTREES